MIAAAEEAEDGSSSSSSMTPGAEPCAACSDRQRRQDDRQQRRRLLSTVLLLWAVPLALAAGRCWGFWGHRPHSTNQHPGGRLILTQVVFRHGARTPFSRLYYPNSTWSHCSQQPLEAAHGSSSSSSGSIKLRLYDPSGAASPPDLSGDDQPLLPGGCRMGALTDTGFDSALELGRQLRRRYIKTHKLLPPHKLDLQLLHAESTAVRRTVTTLRGVLTGLFPNSSSEVEVPVAVRPAEAEIMSADWSGCAALANLTSQLMDAQAAHDESDPQLEELEHQVRSALQLPADAPMLWTRLMDELACMTAEGQQPPAAAAQPGLVAHIGYEATQRTVEVSAPEPGDCLLGKEHEQQCQQVTALTNGRLLHQLVHNMATAASAAASNAASTDSSRSSRLPRRLLAGNTVAVAGVSVPRSSSSGASGGAVGEHSTAGGAPIHVQHPRLMLFSAHDTTLLPLLSALGQQQTSWPHFASNLAFELWSGRHRGQFNVRVLYNEEPLRLPLSAPAAPAAAGGAAAAAAAEAAATGGAAGSKRARQGAASSPAGQRHSHGEQAVHASAAYVVSLDEFEQRVVQDYVLTPKQYAEACAGSGSGSGSVGVGGAQATASTAAAASGVWPWAAQVL